MNKLLLAISVVLIVSPPTLVHADPVADAVLATAQQLQKQLPKQVDQHTTLMAVIAAGRRLKYSYRFGYKKSALARSEAAPASMPRLLHRPQQHLNGCLAAYRPGPLLVGKEDYPQ